MPDRSQLRVGDRIRLLSVPQCDLDQRRRAIEVGDDVSDSTASTIERIMAASQFVTIERIDKFGATWFEVQLEEHDGIHYHSLTILDNESWERVF